MFMKELIILIHPVTVAPVTGGQVAVPRFFWMQLALDPN